MTAQPSEFGIIIWRGGVFWENIHLANVCDTVMDEEVEGEAGEVRRRDMAFGDLVPEQVVTLACFSRQFFLGKKRKMFFWHPR